MLEPKLLVCDEIVSALDVSVQAQILNLLEDLKRAHNLTLFFIAHDLAVVKNVSDRVAVMYLGRLCEIAPSDVLYAAPAHHYTEALLSSAVEPNPEVIRTPVILAGEPPSPINPPSGCRFRTRCPRAEARCAEEVPELRPIAPGHQVACHFPIGHLIPAHASAAARPSPWPPRPTPPTCATTGPCCARPWPRCGIAASTQIWTDPDVRWHEFDLVVANGAWDNIHRPDEFLAWVDRGGGGDTDGELPRRAPLEHGQALPGCALRGGRGHGAHHVADPGRAGLGSDRRAPVSLPGEFVVKPTVSGGGFETARYRPAETSAAANDARAHVRRLLGAGRTVMIQPYQAAVDTHGEAGLIFLGGRYSHAIGKGPLLRPGAGPQTHLYQHEQIGAAHAERGPAGDGPTSPWPQPSSCVGPDHLRPGRSGRSGRRHAGRARTRAARPGALLRDRPAAATRFAQVLRALIP